MGLWNKIIMFLVISGIYALCVCCLRKFENKYRNKIIDIAKRHEDYHDAIKLRESTLHLRKRFINGMEYLVIGLSAIISIAVFITQYNSTDDFWVLFGQCFAVFILSLFILSSPLENGKREVMLGNITLDTFEEALTYKDGFYLYLRSFEKDRREKLSSVQDDLDFPGFSEYYLVRGLLKQVKKVFAIGNPGEVDAPFGASRVYLPLDEIQWKNDILKLMEKAEGIYTVVANTANCKWEIEQVVSLYPNKTTLIVADLDAYNNVRNSGFSELPDLRPTDGWHCYILKKNENNIWEVSLQKKTAFGYEQVKESDKSYQKWISLAGRYILGMAALALLLFFVRKEWEKKTAYNHQVDACKQYWNSLENIRIDSTLFVERCIFDKKGLTIYVESIETIAEIDETQAANSFFFLAGYNLDNMREVFLLLNEQRDPLRIILNYNDAKQNIYQYDIHEGGGKRLDSLLGQYNNTLLKKSFRQSDSTYNKIHRKRFQPTLRTF